jgi:hypothetical protein
MGLINSNLRSAEYSPAERRIFFDHIIPGPIMIYAAYKSGVMDSKAFKLALSDASYGILSQMAQESFRATLRQATDDEIEAHYQKNLGEYFGKNPDGSPRYTVYQKPLDEDMHSHVKQELETPWAQASYEKWKNELITRYQARIYENRFEVKKPPEEKAEDGRK